MFKIMKELPFDKKISVFKKGNTEIQLFRPSVLSKRFKDYDIEIRDMYEHAESMNFMMDHASDKLKARLRKEYKFT